MKRKIFAAFLAVLTFTFAGCGAKKDVELDIDALASDLVSGIVFDDEMSIIDDGMIPMIYSNGEVYDDAVLYMGSGATAEEIAVFECENDTRAKGALEEAKSHIESQIISYEDYIPAEVQRLEQAVVRQAGRYVIVAVTGDPDEAEKIIDNHLK